MANDGGLVAKLEQWFTDQLKALELNSEKVFNTADIWRHQISAQSGGFEAAAEYAPFAFVSYQSAKSAREGGYTLRQVIEFAILIGTESKEAGVARFGSSVKLGTSKIRDLVIELFDRKHPGAELACDEIYYTGEIEIADTPTYHAIQMNFETSFVTN